MKSPFAPFPWRTLQRPLTGPQRAAVGRALRGLLAFQRGLDRWPDVAGVPDATPFVSVYAAGRLRGCYGSGEGDPAERLRRAFLRAVHDERFGGVASDERPALAAQVSYLRAARLVSPLVVEDEIEPGTHGVALVRDRAAPVLLLRQVARDEGFGPSELLAALRRKAGLADDDDGGGALYLFETDDVVARATNDPRIAAWDPRELALAWLASLVCADGRVTFAIDPRSGARIDTGLMMHARAAVAVRALAEGEGHAPLVTRARGWLARQIHLGLRGDPVEAWPSDPAAVAGTLALAALAGVPVEKELAAFASDRRAEVARVPWHAAQVVAAHPAAPHELWDACVADLDRRPWAPWTAIAAAARGDRRVLARTSPPIAAALRAGPPHRGGASITKVPEVALTAVSIEALALHRTASARASALRGRDFLLSTQLVGARLHAGLDPSLCRGAFPASPVVDLLRADVTGHAVLALARLHD